MFSFHMVGDKQLVRKLKKLTGKDLVKNVKKAAAKSMTPISREIRSNINLEEPIPFAAGSVKEQQTLLRKSIGKRTKSLGRGAAIFAVSGVRGGNKVRSLGLPDASASMVEYGTRHTKPQPFVRPAIPSLRNKALPVYTRELAAWIQKQKK